MAAEVCKKSIFDKDTKEQVVHSLIAQKKIEIAFSLAEETNIIESLKFRESLIKAFAQDGALDFANRLVNSGFNSREWRSNAAPDELDFIDETNRTMRLRLNWIAKMQQIISQAETK